MGEINKLKSFRNDKKSYEDRKSHVNSIFAQVDVNDMVRSSLCNEYMMSNLEKSLEDLGTYLLASDDVESERKLKYSFYRNEKYYKTSTNIGKSTFPFSVQDSEFILYKYENDVIDNLEVQKDKKKFNKNLIENMDKQEFKKLINNYQKIKDFDASGEIIKSIDFMIKKMKFKKENDKTIVELKRDGYTINQISEKINMPGRTIRERFDVMVKSACI